MANLEAKKQRMARRVADADYDIAHSEPGTSRYNHAVRRKAKSTEIIDLIESVQNATPPTPVSGNSPNAKS